jgi:hypothetical protein
MPLRCVTGIVNEFESGLTFSWYSYLIIAAFVSTVGLIALI